MVLLDTHVLFWVLRRELGRSASSKLARQKPWIVSPVSVLEAYYLEESGTKGIDADKFLSLLKRDHDVEIHDPPMLDLFQIATRLSWTRDPFDRLLVAHSMLLDVPFATSDRKVLRHYSEAKEM